MNIYRQKLVNVVLFFAKETKHTNMTKLMKLLNFFEFEHFKEAGYPSIGLEYFTFDQGPVPKKFWVEIKDGNLPEDLKDRVIVRNSEWGSGNKEIEFVAKPKALVDFDIFTPREKKILEKLAYIYLEATAKEMSIISHEENMPWEETMREKGKNKEIDYLLALGSDSSIDRDIAKENLRDHFAALNSFDINPVN